MESNVNNKSKLIFGLISGMLYIVFGCIQIVVGFGFRSMVTEAIFIPNDVIGGFILILIGIIFLFGVHKLKLGISEGVAFIFIGIFLALIFVIIYLLVMASNAIEAHVLVNEDFFAWAPSHDLRPGIYLGILPLLGLIIWRSKFSLKK